ncbi:unnamed protein product [Clonostachys rhizophaga]|uniref:TauD/TfdA-like domain-containing protein n=1 Tax=Clonostachys rhizophaga TaxID=160324 RepID=A0A9N9YEL9_9HYPO|nr:unnamed protein product [Clonostachys rhizophaga]
MTGDIPLSLPLPRNYGKDEWVLQFTEGDKEEIRKALQHFKSFGLEVEEVNQGSFPLPTLSQKLEKLANDLHDPRQAFFVLSGLNIDQYTVEEATIIYLGVASYVADQRGAQDGAGNMLTHITSSKLWNVPESVRHGIHSTKALPFHNDMGADILALLARSTAGHGGNTYLTHVTTVYNKLTDEERRVLLEPNWPVQTSGRLERFYLGQALAFQGGRLMSSMDPHRFGPHPKADPNTKIPKLTETQRRVLDRVSEVAKSAEIKLSLKKGDMLFFNNWAVIHRRDAYQDGPDNSRHLVRLWLHNQRLGWSIPGTMLEPWLKAYGGRFNNGLYALDPAATYKIPKYSAGSAAFVLDD